jgi:hypothetical protein
MLVIVAVLLLVIWAVLFLAVKVAGVLVHLLLVLAAILFIVKLVSGGSRGGGVSSIRS